MKRIFTIICLGLLFLGSAGYGQGGQNDAFDIQKMVSIPPSPEAAGFEQYGQTGVNYHMGKPTIQVPLYSHQGREMGLPLLLNYDAGGVRVSQLASNVGLGWSLISSGSITRKTLGLPDDRGGITKDVASGAVQNLIAFTKGKQISEGVRYDTAEMSNYHHVIKDFELMSADTQPDIFSFNTVTGLSGTLYVDYATNTAFSLEDPTIQVEMTGNTISPDSWILTDASGVKYYFSRKEKTRHEHSVTTVEFDHEFTSSWFLTRIESANKKDTYNFNYAAPQDWTEQESLPKVSSHSYRPTYGIENACLAINGTQPVSTDRYKIKQTFLSSVDWNGSRIVDVHYSATRQDLPSSREIDYIIIKQDGSRLRKVDFQYGYFDSTDGTTVPDNTELRLKLESVSIKGTVDSSDSQVWSFDYYDPDGVPARDDNGVDYWGFYNGATNTNLIPPGTYGNTDLGGADRDAVLSHTRKGTLKRIHYPTGGYNEFNYELHAIDGEIKVLTNNNYTFSASDTVGPGNDSNDPYDFDFGGLSYVPNALTGTFQVNRSGTGVDDPDLELNEANTIDLYLKVSGQTSTSDSTLYDQVVIYIFPDTTTWNHRHAITKANNGEALRRYISQPGNYTINLETLPQDTYRYLIYNLLDSATAEMVRVRDQQYEMQATQETLGGLRIKDIVSFTGDGKVANKRVFTYQEARRHEELDFDDYKDDEASYPYPENAFSYGEGPETGLYNEQTYFDQTCNTYVRYSNNQNSSPGYPVSYGRVIEQQVDSLGNANGKTVYDFIPGSFFSSVKPFITQRPLSGKLKSTKVYDAANTLLKKTEHTYEESQLSGIIPAIKEVEGIYLKPTNSVEGYRLRSDQYELRIINGEDTTYVTVYEESYTLIPWNINNNLVPPDCSKPGSSCQHGTWSNYNIGRYSLDVYFARMTSTREVSYYGADSVVTQTNMTYDSTLHFQATQTELIDSEQVSWFTKYYYPDDVNGFSDLPGAPSIESVDMLAINQLKADHRISQVLQTEQLKGSTLLGRTRTHFGIEGSRVLPQSVETARGTDTLETRARYHSYYTNGNIREISQENGTHIVYLWGYNGQYPVAQIQNATYSDVSGIIDQAILDNPAGTGAPDIDVVLRTELAKLRTHPDLKRALITTMTYKPGVGMTSQTTPNGLTSYFEYDTFNRLRYVKDKDQNILRKVEYSYQTEADNTNN